MAPAPSRRKEKPETPTTPAARGVVLPVAVSLDGYIARGNGSVDWLIRDPTIGFGAYTKSFDVIVAGRKTLDVEHTNGGGSHFGKMACHIFSRTRPPGKRGGAEYVNRDVSEFVRDFKALPGRNIWLMGGRELAGEFLKEGLVDRLDLGIMPVLLGERIPLFPSGFLRRNFKLRSHQAHPRGVLRAVYARIASYRSQAM